MRKVGFILHPGYSTMSLVVSTVFEMTNLQAGDTIYEMQMLSESGGPVRTSAGFQIMTERFSGESLDLLVVGGSVENTTPEVIALLRQAPHFARRIAAPCTGAMLLAEAGLLDGRRATTHWMYARDMAERYPKVKVEEDKIFITDGPIWTSAGMTAGIDLALALVEEDLGSEVARQVARKMVMHHRRSGGQSQFSTLLELEPKSDRMQAVLSHAHLNISTRLSVEDLAEVAYLSPRQFSRAFQSETGQTPAKAIEHIRLEAARAMMEDTSHPIDLVAKQTGFVDRDRMRRAFIRAYGQPPQVIRRAAKA